MVDCKKASGGRKEFVPPSQGMLRSTAGKSILLEVRDIETLL